MAAPRALCRFLRYLSMPLEGLAPGGAGSGEDHVKYTMTLELKLPLQRPAPVAPPAGVLGWLG
ncbi:unnamed protein product [Effrenium voratum]|uniref:Uncharacterized protein n=1 Tax=Effrenium voratum TaxID=2562239 RepID=A0AA36HKW8_9DINO|nr:unnamed protein product [Effrenium voratum]